MAIFWATAGIIHAERGDDEVARQLYEELRPLLFAVPHTARWRALVCCGSELAAVFGDTEVLRVVLDEMRPHTALRCDSSTGSTGPVARFAAVVARHLDQRDEAVRLGEQAVTSDRRLAALPGMARSALELGRALALRGGPGDRDRARGVLDEALRTARRLALRSTERDASALLAELSGTGPGAATLTARERETVALVATGLANRDVAPAW